MLGITSEIANAGKQHSGEIQEEEEQKEEQKVENNAELVTKKDKGVETELHF